MGVLWENSLAVFFFLTVVLAGGAAWMSGRAIARGWQPYWIAAGWMLPLAIATRFMHFALFDGTLLSIHYLLVDLVVLLAIAWLGHRVTLASLMTQQYRFAFERASPLSWRARAGTGA